MALQAEPIRKAKNNLLRCDWCSHQLFPGYVDAITSRARTSATHNKWPGVRLTHPPARPPARLHLAHCAERNPIKRTYWSGTSCFSRTSYRDQLIPSDAEIICPQMMGDRVCVCVCLCLGKQTAFYQEHPPAALWEVVQISGSNTAGCEEEDEEEEEAVWGLHSERRALVRLLRHEKNKGERKTTNSRLR